MVTESMARTPHGTRLAAISSAMDTTASSEQERSELERASNGAALEVLGAINPGTDLGRLVWRVTENDLPWVVVSAAAIAGWERRDPSGWARVRDWLAARGVAIVRI